MTSAKDHKSTDDDNRASTTTRPDDRLQAAVLTMDCLAKPIEPALLENMLTKWLAARTGSVQASAAPMAAVDPQVLAQIVGSDPAAIVKFLQIFLASARKGMTEIRAAFGQRSAADITAQAHKLKSAARMAGADALADFCEQLERAGKETDWATLDNASARLEPEFTAVERFIQVYTAPKAQLTKDASMNLEDSPHRALVVDDDEFVLIILTRILESLGFDAIATCASGAEALSRLQRETERPDIVLCDLNMPEMDGVEFLRKLAEIGYDGAIIIISSADERFLSAAETVARGHRLHILGHLEKPVTPDQLKTMLARWQPRHEPRARAGAEYCTADEIRAGLAQGLFVPWFQPEVEIVTGWVVGAEALARWRHPARGMIAPDCFIPVAEQSGLIRELTGSILTQSLRQAQAWHEQGSDIRVGINVSVDDLVRLDLPEQLLELAQAAGVKPSNITLEVTENRLSHNPLASLDILARLRLKRIGLSIGDIGAGYSTLTRLKDFPFDELKVGQSFVRGAVRDSAARDILESTINLGKKLSMRVVAVGVETKEEWDLVAALGCDIAQGYFIAKPMPGPDLQAWIKTWKAP